MYSTRARKAPRPVTRSPAWKRRVACASSVVGFCSLTGFSLLTGRDLLPDLVTEQYHAHVGTCQVGSVRIDARRPVHLAVWFPHTSEAAPPARGTASASRVIAPLAEALG